MGTRCPESLVRELVDPDSMAATTVNPTGVTRLASDWLHLRGEVARLTRERDEARREARAAWAEVEEKLGALAADIDTVNGQLARDHSSDPCPRKVSGDPCYVCAAIDDIRQALGRA